jgi:hypothetical protein
MNELVLDIITKNEIVVKEINKRVYENIQNIHHTDQSIHIMGRKKHGHILMELYEIVYLHVMMDMNGMDMHV